MNSRRISIRIGGPLTPVVRNLLLANGILFIIQQVFGFFKPSYLEMIFGLSHAGLVQEFMLWQPLTYMFFHADWLHLLFNMLSLWMFAGELEQAWGSRRFLRFYVYSGTGAGLCIAAMNYFTFIRFGISPYTIGSSGAIYAIFLAYALLWPHREVYLYFILPVKVRTLLIIFGLIEFLGTLGSALGHGGGVSHIGHVGGIFCGYLLLRLNSEYGYVSSKSRQSSGFSSGKGFITSWLKKYRLRNKRSQIETRIRAKKIIDETLAKIAREGMNSLSSEEKKNLEWARKNYYPDNNQTLH